MINYLSKIFNLHKGEEDKEKTLAIVKSNIYFTGSNLWILACAILIASIGLNVNSTAVIIGAMLISPLMGPIVGAGFALGTYDFHLLKKSFTNLFIATLVSLSVATLYFYISPFKDIQSELLARTSPNIYDVLIAFFGGLVGVIAITRVEKGNPIPGVAIATALMPPLCTAGFGLATSNWKFFLGALFLYIINCVFICIATFSIVTYLKYPAKKQVDVKHQKQVRYAVITIVFSLVVPSIFFAFSMFKERQFRQRVNDYIEREFLDSGNTLLYKKINYFNAPKTIELAFLIKNYSETEVQQLNDKLKNVGLQNTRLIIKANSSDHFQSFKNDILNEVNKKDIALNEKEQHIADLEQKLKDHTFDSKELLSEINIFLPDINAISVSTKHSATHDSTSVATVVIYSTIKKLSTKDAEIFKNWMLKKLNNDQIEIIEKK